ncbi:hypothetical protein EDB83DRAFT_2525417 [Lactarius deliciosus]|nr:hypothetical protein EDB83DRAFT_2525417 [Lactarius deliciosus]
MVHLKIPSVLSIPILISPKFASLDLIGVEVVFGKGRWKPTDEFLGYFLWLSLKASSPRFYHNTIDSIAAHRPSYRNFYIHHHRHHLGWKRSGVHYAWWTTETVKGLVVVLEPAMQRALPQSKILDRVPASPTVLLIPPSNEWVKVTRTSPSDSFLEDGNSSDSALVLSSNVSLQLPLIWDPRRGNPPPHLRGYSGDRSMALEHTSSR